LRVGIRYADRPLEALVEEKIAVPRKQRDIGVMTDAAFEEIVRLLEIGIDTAGPSARSPQIRKQVGDLTPSDLEHYPTWGFAIDEKGEEGQDEETVRPRPEVEFADPGEGLFVRAEFTAADKAHVPFWFGAVPPTPARLDASYRALSKTPEVLFPLRYRALVGARRCRARRRNQRVHALRTWRHGQDHAAEMSRRSVATVLFQPLARAEPALRAGRGTNRAERAHARLRGVAESVRPMALALIRRGQRILVEEGGDETKNETFFRLLGGRIEFGETGADAVRRELREELGVETDAESYLTTVENLFTYEGERGHEIALIYECSLRDRRLYALDAWEAVESTAVGSITHKVVWKHMDSFVSGSEVLYPDGVAALVVSRDQSGQPCTSPSG
jgi:ADP-ribose pyrophosphatase YjhB (NUDIX family)